MCSTTRKSCAMNRYVSFSFSCRSCSRLIICAWIENVERRDRLVEHQEARIHRERPRDPDSLALPARKFVRQAIHRVGAHPDHREQLGDSIFFFFAAREFVNLDSLADDRSHAHPRIQRRVRILKHELHLLPQRAQFRAAKRREIAAVEIYGALGRLEQFQNQPPQRRFARSRLADQSQRLARLNLQIDAGHRFYRKLCPADDARRSRRKLLAEIHDANQRRARRARGRHDRIRRGCRRHSGWGPCFRAAALPRSIEE